MRPPIAIAPLGDLPLVRPGDDLAAILSAAIFRGGWSLRKFDVIVIAQKVISKAEGRYVDLSSVIPSLRAQELAAATDKDPRLVQVILNESRRIVRHRRNVLIVEHVLGFVMANAGVDRSNIDPAAGAEPVLLLPVDPDRSAATIRERLEASCGVAPAVIISDSIGRAWRRGVTGVAIGAAGLPTMVDLRGTDDLFGRPLRATEIGFADEIASAASLAMGQAGESIPAVLVRGLHWEGDGHGASELIRSAAEDLFR